MATDTTVSSLIINKMTKAQYDAIQNPSETELYLVEESIDSVPTSGSNNAVSSGGVYTALESKGNNVIIEAVSGATLTAVVDKYYTLSNVGTLAITLPTCTGTKIQSVVFYISTGSTPAVTFSSTHTILYSDGFEIAADSIYEVNALWNGTAWCLAMVKLEESV